VLPDEDPGGIDTLSYPEYGSNCRGFGEVTGPMVWEFIRERSSWGIADIEVEGAVSKGVRVGPPSRDREPRSALVGTAGLLRQRMKRRASASKAPIPPPIPAAITAVWLWGCADAIDCGVGVDVGVGVSVCTSEGSSTVYIRYCHSKYAPVVAFSGELPMKVAVKVCFVLDKSLRL